jgi:8-oxo-dGTP pyrophosphatase MutT (NUDIX family)
MGINCSVTVMLVSGGRIGFIKRQKEDTYGGMLVAPGGKVEESDGEMIEGVRYFSVEDCAIREVLEETGIRLSREDLKYFCSLTLPNGRAVISLYAELRGPADGIILLDRKGISDRSDFAPGMKSEALLLAEKLGI